MYDHSGITISTTPFSCTWDSCQVGFAIVTKDAIRKEFNAKYVTKKLIVKAEKILDSEIDMYDQELTDNVFGFTCYDENDEVINSVGGFYGDNFEKNGMLEHIEDEEIVEAMKKEESLF